jgi:hypothetical protein
MVLMFPSQPLMTRSGWIEIPSALAKKSPSAAREWPWQWAFPATRNYIERETGQKRRHHLHETVLQHAVRPAVLASGTPKRAMSLPTIMTQAVSHDHDPGFRGPVDS